VNRLRQQLILAQVRLMELEDARDTLAPKVAELTAVVRTAQSLADQKLDEAAHLARVLAEAQAHAAHLAQLHAQASADLAATRAQLATLETQLRQRDDLLAQNESVRAQLTAELRAIKSSRRWRWTAWLRGSDRAS
jgi:chromosome segregation ATPase